MAQNISELETLWEVPPLPTGVLFVAHGCNHAAADFWPPSERCPHCTGLPQERLVRLAALARGYAVVAISSMDREKQCWHNTQADKSEDVQVVFLPSCHAAQRVPGILKQVVAEERLGQLPLFAFGASSGGGFVLRLAQAMPEVQGIIAQIVPARPALLKRRGGQPFPPTLFVHMAERDPEWAAQIEETLPYCRGKGIPAAEVRISPQPVTAELLLTSTRLNRSMAEAIVNALAAGGFLDTGGYVREDPREGQAAWQAALLPVLGSQGWEGVAKDVGQLLNVAYAQHELTGGSTDAALAWLEAGGAASIDELLRHATGQHEAVQQQQHA
ncbi:hypothetical protein COHA_002669 [Chlorella ohadii]|uniref:Uncharacterized protein n=1 Tax=Chlorella ohadii TaxID=2649997 RepID=A0AAD5H4P5_9CHLO|nr:hypothetical protein COHA_002669 [Chlorella ohadii]